MTDAISTLAAAAALPALTVIRTSEGLVLARSLSDGFPWVSLDADASGCGVVLECSDLPAVVLDPGTPAS